MTARLAGPITWKITRDGEGHRIYIMKYEVESDAHDGPQVVSDCPGLPAVGSVWNPDNDFDTWATCKQDLEVVPRVEGQPNTLWDVTVIFSTMPDIDQCVHTEFTDPLTQPPKVSGGNVKYNQEATNDRFGFPIVNSAWEQLRGTNVEFDSNRNSFSIEMNVATFAQVQAAIAIVDHVNDRPIFGYIARQIKLSGAPWEKKYYGNCYIYYTLTMQFDTKLPNFDRKLRDEGTKVLNGHWDGATGLYVVDKIGGLVAPLKPTLKFNNGGLAAQPSGDYTYEVTAVNAVGETLPSPSQTITVPSGTVFDSITISWPAVSGAVSYNIYNTHVGPFRLVGSINAPQTFYVDTHPTLVGSTVAPTSDSTGGVPPNPSNPQHFIRYKDRHNEATKVILNGAGLPSDVGGSAGTDVPEASGPGEILLEFYPEANFLLLGIPTEF